MHSFWYEEALEEFRTATKIQPDFTMGYWGEAMAYNHPIWREQDTGAARSVLSRSKESTNLTARERSYIQAVQTLYGEGEKAERDERYARAMEALYRKFPDDVEAACFYALALLGTTSNSEHGYRRKIQAGALTLMILQEHPDHPCAAHYTIHAFDHPDLAILGLPAARRYAAIAPASHHAQHMPAHIFLQLGMWEDAAARNEKGWATSVEWVKRKGLGMNHRDYHSLHWLLYVYLQQGRYKEAAAILALKQSDMRMAAAEASPPPAPGWEVHRMYAEMVAEWVVETEQWEEADKHWDVPNAAVEDSAKGVALFVRGLAAAMRGRPEVSPALASLRALSKADTGSREKGSGKLFDIWTLEIESAVAAKQGAYDQAIASMKRAVSLEEAMPPPSGPPAVVKPTHELLGEILLQAERPKEAAQQFAVSLERHPRRARSLLGAARAGAALGSEQAAAYMTNLREVWAQADPDIAERQEVCGRQ
jgi:tetratricopeptide (TPR) repeat protein